jgi:exonuclease VII small subunit
MSDTPRKDYLIKYAPIGIRPNAAFEQAVELVDALERELNDANKTISLQHELMTTAEKRGVDKAKEELNEAKDRIKRLEEALAWYEPTVFDCNRIGPQGDAARRALAQDLGSKAKEAKP